MSVTNNVFLGTDPRVPGMVGPVGLWVGNRVARDVPRWVSIRNNTILTGALRTLRGDPFAMRSSILL
ncbi:MAG: hypothetical protein M3304_04565, partial [Actinomycetota bacterium]|nr:hypothetical protein [Actinomycetota bacterium]